MIWLTATPNSLLCGTTQVDFYKIVKDSQLPSQLS